MGIFSIFKIASLKLYGTFLETEVIDIGNQLPEDKPVILAINHTSGADPLVLQAALERRIFFLITGRHYGNRLFTYFFNNVADCIPVYYGPNSKNLSSMKRILKLLKAKRTIGIFPEGDYIKKLKEKRKVFNGAAFIAYKSGVPIYPVYIYNIPEGLSPESRLGRIDVIEGLHSIFVSLFRDIEVYIGDPIYVKKPVGVNNISFLDQVSSLISSEMDRLREIAINQDNEVESIIF